MNINNDSRGTLTDTVAPASVPFGHDEYCKALIRWLTEHNPNIIKDNITNVMRGLTGQNSFRKTDSALCGLTQYRTAKFGGIHYVEHVKFSHMMGMTYSEWATHVVTALINNELQFNPTTLTFAWRFDKIEHERARMMERLMSAAKGQQPEELFTEGRIRVLEHFRAKIIDADGVAAFDELIASFPTECPWLVKFGMQPNPEAFTNS